MFGNDSLNNVDIMLQNPKKALVKMSLPLILSLFVSSFYNLIDAAWVSGLGADALAGVGFFTPIFMVLVGFGNGLGAGASFAISKYIGEDDKIKADNASILYLRSKFRSKRCSNSNINFFIICNFNINQLVLY